MLFSRRKSKRSIPRPEEMQTLTTFRDSVSERQVLGRSPRRSASRLRHLSLRCESACTTGSQRVSFTLESTSARPTGHPFAQWQPHRKIVQPFNVLGGTVAIDHARASRTMYLHMSKLNVEAGAQ